MWNKIVIVGSLCIKYGIHVYCVVKANIVRFAPEISEGIKYISQRSKIA